MQNPEKSFSEADALPTIPHEQYEKESNMEGTHRFRGFLQYDSGERSYIDAILTREGKQQMHGAEKSSFRHRVTTQALEVPVNIVTPIPSSAPEKTKSYMIFIGEGRELRVGTTDRKIIEELHRKAVQVLLSGGSDVEALERLQHVCDLRKIESF